MLRVSGVWEGEKGSKDVPLAVQQRGAANTETSFELSFTTERDFLPPHQKSQTPWGQIGLNQRTTCTPSWFAASLSSAPATNDEAGSPHTIGRWSPHHGGMCHPAGSGGGGPAAQRDLRSTERRSTERTVRGEGGAWHRHSPIMPFQSGDTPLCRKHCSNAVIWTKNIALSFLHFFSILWLTIMVIFPLSKHACAGPLIDLCEFTAGIWWLLGSTVLWCSMSEFNRLLTLQNTTRCHIRITHCSEDMMSCLQFPSMLLSPRSFVVLFCGENLALAVKDKSTL